MLETFESYEAAANRLNREEFLAQNSTPLLVLSDFIDLEETGTRTVLPSTSGEAGFTPIAVAVVRKQPGVNKLPNLITIGRSSANDIRIRAPEVSKFHAYLRSTRDGLQLTDAGSTNGTRVNGLLLAPKVDSILLQPGDQMELGDLRATFHSPGSLYDWIRGRGDQAAGAE